MILKFTPACTISEKTRRIAKALVRDCKTEGEAARVLTLFFMPKPMTGMQCLYKWWFVKNIDRLEAACSALGLGEIPESVWTSFEKLRKIVSPLLWNRAVDNRVIFSDN